MDEGPPVLGDLVAPGVDELSQRRERLGVISNLKIRLPDVEEHLPGRHQRIGALELDERGGIVRLVVKRDASIEVSSRFAGQGARGSSPLGPGRGAAGKDQERDDRGPGSVTGSGDRAHGPYGLTESNRAKRRAWLRDARGLSQARGRGRKARWGLAPAERAALRYPAAGAVSEISTRAEALRRRRGARPARTASRPAQAAGVRGSPRETGRPPGDRREDTATTVAAGADILRRRDGGGRSAGFDRVIMCAEQRDRHACRQPHEERGKRRASGVARSSDEPCPPRQGDGRRRPRDRCFDSGDRIGRGSRGGASDSLHGNGVLRRRRRGGDLGRDRGGGWSARQPPRRPRSRAARRWRPEDVRARGRRGSPCAARGRADCSPGGVIRRRTACRSSCNALAARSSDRRDRGRSP